MKPIKNIDKSQKIAYPSDIPKNLKFTTILRPLDLTEYILESCGHFRL